MSNNPSKSIGVVVLAAGKGTRLNATDIPKVMLPIGGKPVVAYTVEALEQMGFDAKRIVLVVGFCQEKVREYFGDRVTYAEQIVQEGTAHAAYLGMQILPDDVGTVLIVGGDDGAFYRPETLSGFIAEHAEKNAIVSVLTVEVDDPSQLGRICRNNDGEITSIWEKEQMQKYDLGMENVREVSTGTFCVQRRWFEFLYPAWPKLSGLREYALPTVIGLAHESGEKVHAMKLDDTREWYGINTPTELAEADRRKREIRN